MVSSEYKANRDCTKTVVSVVKLEGKHTTYDIEVASRHRFYANKLLVHNCIGSYHPHGDASTYGAMQTLVHHNIPLMEGIGNWGGLLDPAAAYRYCFVGDTRVNTEKGLLKLSTLAKRSGVGNNGEIPFKIKVDTKNEVSQTSYFVNSGIQSVVKVITDRGYSVTCTPNEPFYVITTDGFRWVRADQLKQGDWLCMKRGTKLEVKGSHKLPNSLAVFLGYMVGDGYVNRGQNMIGFNQVDNEVFADFVKQAESVLSEFKEFFRITKNSPRSYGKQEYNSWECTTKKVKSYIKKYDLIEGDSYDRRVPEVVFQGNTAFMSSFLQALFESDGSVTNLKDGSSSTISLTSVSTKLLDEVSLILRSQFGIFSSIVYDKDNCYKLYITGAENVYLFKSNIGFRSARKNKLIRVNSFGLSGRTIGGNNNDCIPYSKELGLSRDSRTRRATFRNKVESGKLLSSVADLLYERDYYYVQVSSVEDAGEAQVWDLTVPKNHSFVADGFVVHNTNSKLSKLGVDVFNPSYTAVMDLVPNYDDTDKEPVVLPVRLPFLILNGAEGIGVGITSSIPTFTIESVLEVLTAIFSGQKLKAIDLARTLKPCLHWGGQLVKSKENKAQWLELMKTGRAKIQFQSTLEVDEKTKSITISEWHNVNPEKLVQKVRTMPECQRAYNSKGSMTFTIECKKAFNLEQFRQFVTKVQKLATSSVSYRFNCTHRTAQTTDGITTYHTEFLSLSVLEFFYRWARLRLELERKSLNWQIERQQKAIDYSNLLIYASTKLEVVFKALKAKDSQAYLVKGLSITPEQANQILELKVRQLSRLDQSQLKEKLKEQKARMTELQGFLKRPKSKIKSEFKSLYDLILMDRKNNDKRKNQSLSVH